MGRDINSLSREEITVKIEKKLIQTKNFMSLHTLFSPKSIAIIGASTRAGSVGNDVAKNLVKSDFRGEVYLVNPKGGELLGKTCYPSIGAISESVDLAIIIVPASVVPAVLREAGEKMVRAAVIISAGFKETGEAGHALEAEIVAIAQEYNIELLGPNCLGFIRPQAFLNASFASTLPVDGPIAFFSQSGALTSAFLDLSRGKLGFSTFASIGNKALINERTLLDHFGEDESTRVIGFYTEGLEKAGEIITLGHKLLAKGKPVIALKSGTTEAGTQASSSHTGAVAGSDAAYDALFRQAGMIRAAHFQELLELLSVFAHNPLPRGNRVAIVTNAGGLGVLATDACIENGLELTKLDASTVDELQKVLPPAANSHNPIDVLGDALAERYAQALTIVAKDKNVDLLLIILTPQTMTEDEKTAKAIVALRKKHPALAMVTVFSGKELIATGERVLEEAHIPNYLYPERAARALGALAQVKNWKQLVSEPSTTPTLPVIDTTKAQTVLDAAKAKHELELGEQMTTEFLKAYELPFLESALVTTAPEAQAFAEKLGKPIALKIASPDIIHKSDVGGVILDIDPTLAGEAFDHLIQTVTTHVPDARITGAMAVEMAEPKCLELLLGLKSEPGLGTLVVVGLGGIYVEVFKDVSMRFAPLTLRDMEAMLDELQAAPLLRGARGQTPVDREQLKRYLACLSDIAVRFPDIVELDINPLAIAPDGTTMRILDARLRLRDN